MNKREQGFTIIELMIASLVFAVILLIVTTAILQLSRAYLKNANDANTQNVARNVNDTVSKAVQFSTKVVGPLTSNSIATNGVISYNTTWYCVNNQVFIFNQGVIYSNSSVTDHNNIGLISAVTPTVCPTVASATAGSMDTLIHTGIELLSPNMAVSRLNISPASTALYNINLIISSAPYNSLLCNTTIASTTTSPAAAGCLTTDPAATDPSQLYLAGSSGLIKCKYQQGDQFCGSEALDNVIAAESKLN